MRFTSLSFIVAIAISCTSCGSDTKTDEPILPPLDLPPIQQGPANSVSRVAGEFTEGFAFAEDSQNNRWLIADKAQGLIAVDKTTDERSVLIAINKGSVLQSTDLQSIASIALDTTNNTLYILDTQAGNLKNFDLNSQALTIAAAKSEFAVTDGFAWNLPNTLLFDATQNRILIGDKYGLNAGSYYAFCLFAYSIDGDSVSVVAADANKAFPLTSTEVKAMALDATNNQIMISAAYYPTNSASEYYYEGIALSLVDWSYRIFYVGTQNLAATYDDHAIAYDSTHELAYMVNSTLGLMSVDTKKAEPTEDGTTPKLPDPILLIPNTDQQSYPLTRPAAIELTPNGLQVLDANNEGLFNLDLTSKSRTLLAAGIPLSTNVVGRPQKPFSIIIDNHTNQPIVVDDIGKQRNALVATGMGFEAFEFPVDLSNITTPTTRTLPTPAEGSSVPPITQSEPKIAQMSYTESGDLIAIADDFERATSDPYVRNIYPAAIYRRKKDAAEAEIITVATEGDSKVKQTLLPFDLNEISDLTATDTTLLLVLNHSDFLLWNYSTQEFSLESTTGSYRPANVTGVAANPAQKEFFYIDANHDALMAWNTETSEIKVISGRQTASKVALALPSGLAFDSNKQVAYTFENTIKTVVKIDIATGERTRLDSAINYITSISKIALNNDGSKLYLIEKTQNRVIEFDTTTYEQRWVDL